jgi:hypothetical protein
VIKDVSFLPGRSNAENRFFHGCVVPLLAEHCGYDQAEMKEILKAKFLSETRVINTVKGVAEIQHIKPTSSLSTVAFESFLDKIRQWSATDLGVVVPLPSENLEPTQ